jgi:hypothetical protein
MRIDFNDDLYGIFLVNADPDPGSRTNTDPCGSDPDPGQTLPSQKAEF